jgi:antitoxin component YwqK of YwqJK toxin-antitoxin module
MTACIIQYNTVGLSMAKEDEVYTGETKKGKRHGFGHCRSKDKTTYTGEWKNGKKCGYGMQIGGKSKIAFLGRFADGEYDGYGTLYPAPGNKEHILTSGEWCKGELNGLGVIINKNGGPSYAGELKGYGTSGIGCWYNKDGSIKAGTDASRNENAVTFQHYPDGRHSVSHWHNGVLHGDHIEWLTDGTKIISNYENGEQSGPATIYRPDGSITVGIIDEAGFQGEFMTIGNDGIKIFKYFKDDKQIGNVTVLMPDGESCELTLKEAKRRGI